MLRPVQNFATETQIACACNCRIFQLTGKSSPIRPYKVMVIVTGDDYIAGDSMMTPGHILAEKEIVVVTFNYRLGALGKWIRSHVNKPRGCGGSYEV